LVVPVVVETVRGTGIGIGCLFRRHEPALDGTGWSQQSMASWPRSTPGGAKQPDEAWVECTAVALSAGATLGPYEIIGPIGVGGMGEVYRARDVRLRRDVAIKVLQAGVVDPVAAERLQREARTASALNHPHICAIYDIGETNGRSFLVMELLEGRTLRQHLAEQRINAASAIAIAIQVADALAAAHAKGVIHRDIKAGNIIIDGSGHVTVLDFGLAKQVVALPTDETRESEALTQHGHALGTPQYMAPEVWQGRDADVRSDIWSLGILLYEMLAGRVPFARSTSVETAAAILHEPLPSLPAHIQANLRAIVERCLAKSPDARYQEAGELRLALEALRAPAAGLSGPTRRRWKGIAVATALVLLLAVALVGRFGRAEPEPALTVTGAPASKDPEANDAFTLAMQFQRVQNDLVRSQQQRALSLDPEFAEARRYHAFNYVIQILNGFSNDTTLLYKAEEELRQAERDAPTLASLPSAFASVYLLQGRKDMIPAVALDRVSVQESVARDAMLWRAIIAWLAGENLVVKDLARQLLEREPLFGAPRMFLAETLRTEGDVVGAIRELRRVLEQAPNNISAVWWLVLAYLDADRPDDARALLEEKRGLFAMNYLWRTSWALLQAREGQRTEALAALDAETLKFGRGTFVATLPVAEIYATLGEHSQAIEWVETAVRNGDERLEWFRRNPRLASIRDAPRFQQMLQAISARRVRRP
jgi:tetratricopeptide (TPR) repeat protein